jgi:hypothetical protein
MTTLIDKDDHNKDEAKTNPIELRMQQLNLLSPSNVDVHDETTGNKSTTTITNDIVQLLQEDYERIVSVGEECINTNELIDLLIRVGRGSKLRTITISPPSSTPSTTSTTAGTTTDVALEKDEMTATTATATTTSTAIDLQSLHEAIGFNLYDGFEPSGRMHIAQGIYKVRNVNKCTYHQNGGTFIFWIADWFALMKYVWYPFFIS